MKKAIFFFVLGVVLTTALQAYASTTISSTAVLYNKNGTVVTVDAAITELMEKSASGAKVTKLSGLSMASTAGYFTSSTINLTSYANYRNLTVDDILYVPTRIELGRPWSSWNAADNSGVGISISKSYNASTGLLTLTASGTNGTSIGFGFVNANWNSYFDIYIID